MNKVDQEKLTDLELLVEYAARGLEFNIRTDEKMAEMPKEALDSGVATMPLFVVAELSTIIGALIKGLIDNKVIREDAVMKVREARLAEAAAEDEEGEVCPGCGKVHEEGEEGEEPVGVLSLLQMFREAIQEQETDRILRKNLH